MPKHIIRKDSLDLRNKKKIDVIFDNLLHLVMNGGTNKIIVEINVSQGAITDSYVNTRKQIK